MTHLLSLTRNDVPCLCSHETFTSATLDCASATCGQDDLDSTQEILTEICSSGTFFFYIQSAPPTFTDRNLKNRNRAKMSSVTQPHATPFDSVHRIYIHHTQDIHDFQHVVLFSLQSTYISNYSNFFGLGWNSKASLKLFI